MTNPNDDNIRERAYQLWEKEGRPEGCEMDHWLKAKAELTGGKQSKGEKLTRRKKTPTPSRRGTGTKSG